MDVPKIKKCNTSSVVDIEDLYNMNSLVSKFNTHNIVIDSKTIEFCNDLYNQFMENTSISKTEFKNILATLRRTYSIGPKLSQLSFIYKKLVFEQKIKSNKYFESLLTIKGVRGTSGVLVVTVTMSDKPFGNDFTCEWNCTFCPSEPGQPKSYLSDEPAIQRAMRNNYDPYLQFIDRIRTQWINGHPIDKIEIIILGGTYSSYPAEYRKWFIHSLIYAANICFDEDKREMFSLNEEITINENGNVRIIGITIETRPDTINNNLLLELRQLNITRIQMGLQHTNDDILRKSNRGHLLKHTIRGIQSAMDVGFKVDIHIMTNMDGSTSELDREMFTRILSDVRIQGDQWKIYPLQVTPWTQVSKDFKDGKYVPYNSTEMFELLLQVKTEIFQWIRNNRIIRDFPSQYDEIGNIIPNMRQNLHRELHKRGLECKCIRCVEVKNNISDITNAKLVIRHRESIIADKYSVNYNIDGINNYFISIESNTDKRILYGFLRLRITNNANVKTFPELQTNNNVIAFIRELHVYGNILSVNNTDDCSLYTQHRGFGRQLLQKAEQVTFEHSCNKISVISGIGVRKYYEKYGYTLQGIGQYMIKNI